MMNYELGVGVGTNVLILTQKLLKVKWGPLDNYWGMD